MTDAEITAAAKALYDAVPVAKPDWDQLMHLGATQSVWRERAIAAHYEDLLS